MTRLRDLGVTPGRLPTGPQNAITDVPGVRVGHVTLIAGDGPLVPGTGPIRTGVTAILPHGGDLFQDPVAAAVYTINGFGKVSGFEQVRELGAIEAPVLLTNTMNVGLAVDALGTYVMREQLNKLVEATRLSNVIIQVIPTAHGAHEGFRGPFIVADFRDHPSVAYQDTAVRGMIVDDAADVASLMVLWDTLRSVALPVAASLEVIEEVAKSWT